MIFQSVPLNRDNFGFGGFGFCLLGINFLFLFFWLLYE